jgi:hypothetical protein
MNNETPYTNREIDQQHKDVMDTLARIEVQTTKTNGSVAKAFIEISKLKSWQTGVIMCGGLFILIILPLCVYIYTNQVSQFNEQIKILNIKDK